MNCIVVDDDNLSRKVVEEFIKKTEFLTLIESFQSAVDALGKLNKSQEIDLIFLDVEMPEMTGIELLGSMDNIPQVVIMSAKGKYAIDAFEYDVTDYLLKPLSYARFIKAANKAKSKIEEQQKTDKKDDVFFIKSSSSLIRLKYDDILCVEALENYVVVNTFEEKYTIHFTMKSILSKLPQDKFLRVHRSYIVNITKINLIEDNFIIVKTNDGKKRIPIARSYRSELMKKINLVN